MSSDITVKESKTMSIASTSRKAFEDTVRKQLVLKRQVRFHDEIHFSNTQDGSFMEDRVVIIQRKLDQGDSSRCVFLAKDARSSSKTRSKQPQQLYALKQISCQDNNDEMKSCRKEILVHRALMEVKNENIIPQLGAKFENNLCYMLFPYISQSLAD